jgi:two-component system sensor histidine kinase BaeS
VKTTTVAAGNRSRPGGSRARGRGPWIGLTGLRLALAMVIICITAIGTVLAIASATVAADVNRLESEQSADLSQALALASAVAHTPAGWDSKELAPVMGLVTKAGAAVQIRDRSGRVIRRSPGFARFRSGFVRRQRVIDNGGNVGFVGWVTFKFGRRGLAGAISHYETLRWHIRIASAVSAVLLALIVSLLVSRRLTAPVDRLIAAVRAMGAGDNAARVGEVRGVTEVRELSAAFDQMAESISSEARLRREMAVDLAHELRAPIAVLQAGLEAMQDGLAELTSENLGSLRDEVVRLAQMADDLGVLASGQSAALKVELARHDLAAIAAEAAQSFTASFEAANVRLTLELAPAHAMCDARRMHEVAVNLLSNAVKFTPAGGTVTLETGVKQETGRVPSGGQIAMLRVGDTGIGIPAGELPHVAQRFFRGQQAAGVPGSGIGLAIVDQLARLHHGRMQVVSEPGHGTQVTVRLPAA